LIDRHPPSADQHVLAAFIQEGHLERHIRRIRKVYAENRLQLIDMVERHIPKHLGFLQSGDQGMHMLLWLADHLDDRAIAQSALEAGISIKAVSPTYSNQAKRSGLILGLGDFDIQQMEQAVTQLAKIIQHHDTLRN
jgi:GntR family transcriptional regulator/MocR family aminotransferase